MRTRISQFSTSRRDLVLKDFLTVNEVSHIISPVGFRSIILHDLVYIILHTLLHNFVTTLPYSKFKSKFTLGNESNFVLSVCTCARK